MKRIVKISSDTCDEALFMVIPPWTLISLEQFRCQEVRKLKNHQIFRVKLERRCAAIEKLEAFCSGIAGTLCHQ